MLLPLTPSILLATSSLFILPGIYFRLRINRYWGIALFVLAIGVSIPSIFEKGEFNDSGRLAGHVSAFTNDGLAQCQTWIAITFALLSAVAIFDASKESETGLGTYGILLFATAALTFVVRSNDLVSLGLSLELLFRSLDVLVRHGRDSRGSVNATELCTTDGPIGSWTTTMNSGWFWLGTALLAGSLASTNFDSIRDVLSTSLLSGEKRIPIQLPSKLILLAVGLIAVSMFARLRLIPFQLKSVKSHRGFESRLSAISQSTLYLAATATLIRLFGKIFVGLSSALAILFIAICLVNFVLVALIAVRCLSSGVESIPNWVYCAGLLQSSWLLVGLLIAAIEGQPSGFRSPFAGQPGAISICVLAQVSTMLIWGSVQWSLTYLKRIDRDVLYFEDLKGLIRYSAIPALNLVIATAAAIGIPFTLGFWSRWWTILLGHNVHFKQSSNTFTPFDGLRLTILFGTIATVIMAVVAIRLIREMTFETPLARPKANGGRGALIASTICATLILVLGFVPHILL